MQGLSSPGRRLLSVSLPRMSMATYRPWTLASSPLSKTSSAPAHGLLSQLGRRESWADTVLSRTIPGELWGAANAVSAAVKRSYSLERDRGVTKASQAIPSSTAENVDLGETSITDSLRERLDFKPSLSAIETAVCLLVPAAICAVLYFVTRPAAVSILYATGIAMVYAAWVAICRALLLERQYSMRLVPETELAGKDSRFRRLDGVNVHYKVRAPADGALRAAIHCYHGFGANTGSWTPVHKDMAHQLGAQISLHDMPGFGLTERPSAPSFYSLEFNGRLGRQIMDAELAAHSSARRSELHSSASSLADHPAGKPLSEPSTASKRPSESGRVQRVLMGHSMGSACAAAEAIKHPEGLDKLILVAPAVVAFGFLTPRGAGKSGEFQTAGNSGTVTFSGHDRGSPVKAVRPKQKNVALRVAIALAQSLVSLFSTVLTRLLEPFTIIGLRATVRSRAFWEGGLGRAWFEKTGMSPETVDAYRLPQLVRGWEKGFVRFTAARLTGGRSIVDVLKEAWKGEVQPTQAEMLADVIAQHNIKVLIVHGENDALVPYSNSRRLAALLPNAQLVSMPRTGHVPHEERPAEFLKAVDAFLAAP